MNFTRIRAIVEKEARQLIRDPLFLTMAFFVPSFFMLLFGYGLSLDVENLPFAMVDHDMSAESRKLVYHFVSSRYFSLKASNFSEKEALKALMEGKIRLVIIVPPDYEKTLAKGRAAKVQFLIDGTFPYRAQVVKNYVEAILGRLNTERLKDYLRAQGFSEAKIDAFSEPVKLEVRYLYNEEAKSVWSIAAALIGMILLMVPPMLTSVSICREKETGSIYNIYVSPVSRGEFLIGKIIPYFFISAINIFVLFLWATALFGAPFRGSFLLYVVSAAIYVLCSLSIGLWVSSFARTQIAALMISVVIAMIPSFLYSGMLVPISCLDETGKVTAHLFPAMYFVNILFGLFLKGSGFAAIKTNLLALCVYTCIIFSLAYRSFHKRVKG
ncbi:ABC transporter permease [Thermodesulfatator atlanticus]|uniref:ABC transporter permease n=1 Tax=Thermodesulfatator atlanticus TaxID=501497 RepID=UPI0003B435ED|nr:ABC transporter permease [Thermodesulfatator atlanticus]